MGRWVWNKRRMYRNGYAERLATFENRSAGRERLQDVHLAAVMFRFLGIVVREKLSKSIHLVPILCLLDIEIVYPPAYSETTS